MVVMVADEEAQMIPKCSPSCFGSAQFALQDWEFHFTAPSVGISWVSFRESYSGNSQIGAK